MRRVAAPTAAPAFIVILAGPRALGESQARDPAETGGGPDGACAEAVQAHDQE